VLVVPFSITAKPEVDVETATYKDLFKASGVGKVLLTVLAVPIVVL
jgi:hypothetical protein